MNLMRDARLLAFEDKCTRETVFKWTHTQSYLWLLKDVYDILLYNLGRVEVPIYSSPIPSAATRNRKCQRFPAARAPTRRARQLSVGRHHALRVHSWPLGSSYSHEQALSDVDGLVHDRVGPGCLHRARRAHGRQGRAV